MHKFLNCITTALCVSALHAGFGTAHAQQTYARKPLMLITSSGPGGITLPSGGSWKPESLTVYDKGTRPVAQFAKGESGLTASFILFENRSGSPTSEGCRKDAIVPIVTNDGKLISKRVDGEAKAADGTTLATTSYLLDMSPAAPGHHQRNLFAFAGNEHACAEIHVSTVRETAADEDALKAVLADFHPNLTYTPSAEDYFVLASILFKTSPGLASPYYKSSLDAMPRDASFITPRRVATDQLIMSLGISGDLKNSRAVAEMAIANDPDYPLNYYNLACADAEEGNAAQAKIHLEQAFDHRANVLKGENMPDPSKDNSIL